MDWQQHQHVRPTTDSPGNINTSCELSHLIAQGISAGPVHRTIKSFEHAEHAVFTCILLCLLQELRQQIALKMAEAEHLICQQKEKYGDQSGEVPPDIVDKIQALKQVTVILHVLV